MGTIIFKLLMWLAWQGLKVVHVMLKSDKIERRVIRPVLEAVA